MKRSTANIEELVGTCDSPIDLTDEEEEKKGEHLDLVNFSLSFCSLDLAIFCFVAFHAAMSASEVVYEITSMIEQAEATRQKDLDFMENLYDEMNQAVNGGLDDDDCEFYVGTAISQIQEYMKDNKAARSPKSPIFKINEFLNKNA